MKSRAARAAGAVLVMTGIGLWTATSSVTGRVASAAAPLTHVIDIQDLVIYRYDTFDVTQYGSQPGLTMPLPLRPFMSVVWLGDVLAVNGVPARGSLTVRGTAVGTALNTVVADWVFDVQRTDGSPVGTLVATGWAFGSPPADSPGIQSGNLAVVGGTGAFVGVSGQGGQTHAANQRFASVTESPGVRRTLGGGTRQFAFRLVPAAEVKLN